MCHIRELLSNYFKEEIVDFEKVCVGCKKKLDILKI